MSKVDSILARHRISRRAAFRLAAATSAVPALAACGTTPVESVPIVDPLVALSAAARDDASAAQASIALLPESAAALTTVMTERNAHADTLDREIARTGTVSTSPSVRAGTPAPSSSAPAPVAPVAPVTLVQIKDMLTASARGAADLGKIESGYRAGLLGSISAACSVHVGVLLS